MGVDFDWGLIRIKSGQQDGETVERTIHDLRLTCAAGSGWKLVIVDEADYASQKAK